ncbi:hypothetical protein [Microcystis aeruginosa]|uniref:Uncharacterized protein n=2 Tax=Microcystis aeruginosa (strain PCC 7806) TaxID=267872 RepID=A0AB33BGV9_MICA7|nr:hypothetical protein [Microcystis aeruginosa]ARI80197.1 hypothetical protein BH695_0916 [Microcystis aeruginosa PCC 7806SL]ELS44850.1 hypothetical protein C789_5353 [Microcystis aeruginosa FACHB-905 = DIANCHI905]UGS08236.1 hypothetical protein LRR78_18860 [Microcystis aeruginosa FACHB-905 = DIANCHI905]WKX63447.1 hypothetical protein Q3H53_003571 [Microcystis aeruginosa PCC 7806]CAO86669.1 unnamed protein product [Microcystis aeruginosa PCC 7806]
MKIEGERSYFCTNINLIICVQTEVNPNWIEGEEAAIVDILAALKVRRFLNLTI